MSVYLYKGMSVAEIYEAIAETASECTHGIILFPAFKTRLEVIAEIAKDKGIALDINNIFAVVEAEINESVRIINNMTWTEIQEGWEHEN